MILTGQKKVIVLEWTTEEQLGQIKDLLSRQSQIEWDRYNKELDTTSKEPDLDIVHALQNICCDLEVPGYEMS